MNRQFFASHAPKSVAALLALAVLVMALQIGILGGRHDGETVFVPSTSESVFHESAGESVFLVCSSDAEPIPPNLHVDISNPKTGAVKGLDVEISEPRPLDAPLGFADKYGLTDDIHCGVSDFQTISPGELKPVQMTSMIVIEEYSVPPASLTDSSIFLMFLLLLGGAIAISCLRPLKIPDMKFYESFMAFVLALLLSMGLAVGISSGMDSPAELAPSFGNMLGMMAANFMAFLIVATGYFFFHARKKIEFHAPQQSASSLIGVPILCAVGLVIIAGMTVFVAPLPGLTTTEIAALLVSTRFVTAHFAVLAGICEECLFRGVIQTGLMARDGSRYPRLQNAAAIGMTTLLFVSLHVPQSMEHLWALLPIALVSVTSGILRIRSGGISQSILLHTSYNAILLLPSVFLSSEVL